MFLRSLLLVTLWLFAGPAFAQPEYTGGKLVSRAKITATSVADKKAKLRQSTKAALKLVKKLQTKFPELELSGLIDALTVSRASAKRLKKLPIGLQRKVNALSKTLKSNLKAETPDITELAELIDEIESEISEGQTSSGESSLTLRLTPVLEDVFYTDEESVPSGITRLPNLQGLPDAFTVTELFFQNENVLSEIQAALADTPSNSECLAFRPTTDGARAAYEGCQGASAAFSPISDIANAATDSCIASLVVNPESLKGGVSIKSGSLSGLTSLFKKSGTVTLELSTGEKIFVTTRATKGKKLDVDVWSCEENAASPKSLNTLTVTGDTYLLGFWGTRGGTTTQGSLTFELEVDEDSFLQPVGAITANYTRESPTALQKVTYTFSPDGTAEVRNYSVFDGTREEKRLTVAELFLLGFDRIRIGRYGSAYQYGSEAVLETGFDFGTTNYIVENENTSFLSGLVDRALDSSFFSTPPLTPTGEVTTHSCAPTSQLVLTVNMNAEAVQDAIQPCTAVETLSELCNGDDDIRSAAVDFHESCL